MKLQLWTRSKERSSKRIHPKSKPRNLSYSPSSATSIKRSTNVREKETDIDTVLPPAFELIGNQPGILRYTDLDGKDVELDYRQIIKQDSMPIPLPVDREHYGTIESSPHFWATGHGDWLNVNEAIERFAGRPRQDQKLRLLDFGCATGRFLRHCYNFGAEKFDCWGCDFAPANVRWVKRHLSDQIKIVLTTNVPHLPFPDGSFDVITAFSVLTHIDDLEDAWLLELRRVTRPGGLLYLTIHNQATWDRVVGRPGSFESLLHANKVPGNLEVRKQLFAGPMPEERIVFRTSPVDIYNCDVYMTNEYVHKKWGRYFEILGIADNGHTSYQSPVIMRPSA